MLSITRVVFFIAIIFLHGGCGHQAIIKSDYNKRSSLFFTIQSPVVDFFGFQDHILELLKTFFLQKGYRVTTLGLGEYEVRLLFQPLQRLEKVTGYTCSTFAMLQCLQVDITIVRDGKIVVSRDLALESCTYETRDFLWKNRYAGRAYDRSMCLLAMKIEDLLQEYIMRH